MRREIWSEMNFEERRTFKTGQLWEELLGVAEERDKAELKVREVRELNQNLQLEIVEVERKVEDQEKEIEELKKPTGILCTCGCMVEPDSVSVSTTPMADTEKEEKEKEKEEKEKEKEEKIQPALPKAWICIEKGEDGEAEGAIFRLAEFGDSCCISFHCHATDKADYLSSLTGVDYYDNPETLKEEMFKAIQKQSGEWAPYDWENKCLLGEKA